MPLRKGSVGFVLMGIAGMIGATLVANGASLEHREN